jgi:uncharacterized protein YutE (UPF0331/DUF86 family)
MKLNEQLIRTRCSEIGESLHRLRQMRTMPASEFSATKDAQDIAAYRLLVAIEAALSICFHLVAKKAKRAPDTYAECFAAMAEEGLIPQEMAAKLQHMARFRNMLIHRYWNIDPLRLHEIISDDIDDLDEFCAAVASLI